MSFSFWVIQLTLLKTLLIIEYGFTVTHFLIDKILADGCKRIFADRNSAAGPSPTVRSVNGQRMIPQVSTSSSSNLKKKRGAESSSSMVQNSNAQHVIIQMSTSSPANLMGGLNSKQITRVSPTVQPKGQRLVSHVSSTSSSNLKSKQSAESISSMVQKSKEQCLTTEMAISSNANLLDGTHGQRNAESTIGSAQMSTSSNAILSGGVNHKRNAESMIGSIQMSTSSNTNLSGGIHRKRIVADNSSMAKRLATQVSTSLPPIQRGNGQNLTPPISKSLPSNLLGNINKNECVAANFSTANRLNKRNNKKNPRRILSSTVQNSNSNCEFGSNFSTITSEEDFSSFENQSSATNQSSSAQLLSPLTQAALANISE